MLYLLYRYVFVCSQVSGISTEIFRQIEQVENDHDATTAAALEVLNLIKIFCINLIINVF